MLFQGVFQEYSKYTKQFPQDVNRFLVYDTVIKTLNDILICHKKCCDHIAYKTKDVYSILLFA